MKVICPECSSEFRVPSEKLGTHGRRVRCANCGHIWLQEPEDEDSSFSSFRRLEAEDPAPPIPSSVHPHADDAALPNDKDGFLADINLPYLGRMMAGFVHPIIIGMLGVWLISALSDHNVFKLENVDMKITVTKAGDELTTITGLVKNNSQKIQDAPQVEILQKRADGAPLKAVYTPVEATRIEAGKSASFAAQIHGHPPAGGKILLKAVD